MSPDDPSPQKKPRADAQRSAEALIKAAQDIFASDGVDAPVREIAKRAGVGVGTLYRNFPTRADLIAAVFRREIDACADVAPELALSHPPFDALSLWIARYGAFLATKRGFGTALYSGDPAYAPLPAYVRARFEPALAALLDAAVAEGTARADISAPDVLGAIGRLSATADDSSPETAQNLIGVFTDGLRTRTTSA